MRVRRTQMMARSGNPFEGSDSDLDPNAYITNLADCMLVLACGLMVALVVAWSVDLPNVAELEQTGEMTEVDNVEDITGESGEGSGYEELGKIYQDPATGKMYMIQEEGAERAGGTASDETASGESSSGGSNAAASNGMAPSQTGTRDVPQGFGESGTGADAEGN